MTCFGYVSSKAKKPTIKQTNKHKKCIKTNKKQQQQQPTPFFVQAYLYTI